MRRALVTALFVVLVAAPALHAAPPVEPISDALLGLYVAGSSYVLQRDALLTADRPTEAELTALYEHQDWRVQLLAELIVGLRHRPEQQARVSALEPVLDRVGRPRFVGPELMAPEARIFIWERLQFGGEPPAIRASLARTLIGLGGDWEQLLARLLADEHEAQVRLVLVSGMRGGDAQTADSVFALALLDPDPAVRAEACRSIGWRGDGERWGSALMTALSDQSPEVRAMAARSLGWTADAEAWRPLLSRLDDSAAEVRLHALRALARIDVERAAAIGMLRRLQQDPDARVSRLATGIVQGH